MIVVVDQTSVRVAIFYPGSGEYCTDGFRFRKLTTIIDTPAVRREQRKVF